MRSHQVIAQRGPFALHSCPSGAVTLSVGPVSVRLQRAVVDQLRDFLDDAVTEMQRHAAPAGEGWPWSNDARCHDGECG